MINEQRRVLRAIGSYLKAYARRTLWNCAAVSPIIRPASDTQLRPPGESLLGLSSLILMGRCSAGQRSFERGNITIATKLPRS
jgi:hypothetical protein